MRTIREFASQSLHFRQPSAMKMHYELTAGDAVIGTIVFRSAFGTFATAESGDGCWTFKRVGFWGNRVTVRACGSETDLATFRASGWGGNGVLELAGGRAFQAATNFWKSHFEFRGANDASLVRFTAHGFVHLGAEIEIESDARDLPELPLLVLFGWYLLVMLSMDSGAVAAAAT